MHPSTGPIAAGETGRPVPQVPEFGQERAALLAELRRCRIAGGEFLALPDEHRASIRAHVGAYVARLRGAEVAPETAVVAVKRVLQEWMPTVAPPVRETIVRWSIDAYFAAHGPDRRDD